MTSLGTTTWWLRFSMSMGGLILGTIGYIAAAIALENCIVESEPGLSHGQQAALISTPLCGLTGAMIGLAIALVIERRAFLGIAMFFVTGCVGAGIICSLWSGQISQYGRDSSEIVLYYPPLGASFLCCFLGILTSLMTIRVPSASE